MVGLGEAGYGSVGAALIASHFPSRMRGALLAGFFASASVGSVLGVMLGGVIASRWGWQAAFGVVGVPGLVLALLYLKVRDYRTVELAPGLDAKRQLARRGRAAHRQGAGAFAHHAVGLHRRRRAADRGLGDVVVAAQLPEPRARHRAGPGGAEGRPGGAGRCRRRGGLGRRGRPRRRAPAAPQADDAGAAVPGLAGRADDGLRRCRWHGRRAVRADRCSAAS